MKRKWVGKSICIAGLIGIAVGLSALSSCARSQQLTGITISPSAFTFFSPAAPGSQPNPIPLTAYGTYIHPPETKDITSQVTWASDQTIVADVSNAGVLTAGTSCGVANVSASFYTDGNKSGNVVVGTMTVTVEGPASQGCPTGTATSNLSVDVTSGAADGVITSTPGGITCGPTCSASFSTGSTVTLTAAPNNGHSFLGWASGCTSTSGATCEVTMNSNVIVTASFN
jgi:Divergent InlB B-repeat domain